MKYWCCFFIFSFFFLYACKEEETENVLINKQNYVEMATLVSKESPLFLLDNGQLIKAQSEFFSTALVVTKRMLLRYSLLTEIKSDTIPAYISASRPIETMGAVKGDYLSDSTVNKLRTPATLHRFWIKGDYLNCELGYNLRLLPHYVRLFVVRKEMTSRPHKLYLELFHSKLTDPLGTYYKNYYSFDLSDFLDDKEKEYRLFISLLTENGPITYERFIQR